MAGKVAKKAVKGIEKERKKKKVPVEGQKLPAKEERGKGSGLAVSSWGWSVRVVEGQGWPGRPELFAPAEGGESKERNTSVRRISLCLTASGVGAITETPLHAQLYLRYKPKAHKLPENPVLLSTIAKYGIVGPRGRAVATKAALIISHFSTVSPVVNIPYAL